MEEFFQVGVITSTHGIKGEVKVFPTTDDVKRFEKLKQVILNTGKEHLTLEIQRVKFFNKFVILKFKDIDDINDATQYRRCPLLVPRAEALPLDEGEYYVADLIGLSVFTEDGKKFGRLTDVMATGANDVYVVDSPEHGEVLLPAIRQCIREIDAASGKIIIHLMDGLI